MRTLMAGAIILAFCGGLALAQSRESPKASASTVDVVEFYNAAQDHYFISSLQPDIDALDSGKFAGWVRTGMTFKAYPQAVAGASPVCRFYIPPANGDSHFFSASPNECAQTAAKFPSLVLETSNAMYIDLPDPATGACPAGDVAVYRVWDNRADSNHRYMTSTMLRAQMNARGWITEGYGPPAVIMCAASPVLATDLRGIYVYSENFADLGSPANQPQLVQALSVPGVDGLTLLIGWMTIEPSKDAFDWNRLDAWINAAASAGKKIALAIRAGQNTPCWLFAAPMCGAGYNKGYAGAKPLSFEVSPRSGIGQTSCTSETIAAPWDPVFQSEWDGMLAALAAHLKSAGTYTAVTQIRITGINRTTVELRLADEILSSPCVTNSVQTWLQATPPFRPSRLLAAFDTITTSFERYFPDKLIGLEIVPTDTGAGHEYPFPPIDENGCAYSPPASAANTTGCLDIATVPDQNAALLVLAQEKFAGRLAIAFQNLDLTTGANAYTVQAAQSLGAMLGFQTNDYNSLQQAACSGGVVNFGPCDAASYLSLLETGIYPLGKNNPLRAQYVEVLAPDAIAFPSAVLRAHQEIFGAP